MVLKLGQIQEKGQLTIPKIARAKFGLRKGDTVQIKVEEDLIKVIPLDRKTRLKRVDKALSQIGADLKRKNISYEKFMQGYQKILDQNLKKDYPSLYRK